MGKRRELSASSGERSLTFQRARWKHWIRYFGVFVLGLLNVSLVASTIQIHSEQIAPDVGREIVSFVVVFFFDVTIFLPILLEVDKILVLPDKIVLSTLFWKSKIPWESIRGFYNPVYLTYAIVKAPGCFYLINKRDMKPLDELLETIEYKMKKAQE